MCCKICYESCVESLIDDCYNCLEMFRCKVCMVEGCFLVEEHRSLFEIFSFMFVRLVNVLRVL